MSGDVCQYCESWLRGVIRPFGHCEFHGLDTLDTSWCEAFFDGFGDIPECRKDADSD